MPQCEATTKTPGRENTGKRCLRMAVHGSKVCERHGGVEDSKTPTKVRKRVDRPGQRCTASKRDGSPCNAYAIKGSYVCMKHGGNLPNVRKAAADRMLALLPLAVQQIQAVLVDPDASNVDRIRAATLVLDRTGLGAKSELTVEVRKYEHVMGEIFRAVPEGVGDGAYSITSVPPPAALTAGLETSGDDWSPQPAEDDSTTAPVDLGAYRATRGSANPPPHLR